MKQKKLVLSMTLALGLAQQTALAQFEPILELSDLNGLNGFVINGTTTGGYSGVSATAAGDINGDGIDDLVIGALGTNANGNDSAGSSYVVFGSAIKYPSPFNLSTLNGSNGFILNGINEGDFSGASVSGAGDINGDGVDDLIIGSPGSNNVIGSSYVVFGSDNPLPNPFNLSTLNGFNGFALNGEGASDRSGASVSDVGDINGDGIDDIIVGAFGANNLAGKSYVVFGSEKALPSLINLSTLNGQNGFTIHGIAAYNSSGFSVSGAGDINGDGLDDLIVGAPGVNSNTGSSYVIFGSNHPIPRVSVHLSSLNGFNGFALNGVVAYDNSGASVSIVGDINSDGIDDLAIGAWGVDAGGINRTGSSYVVFGSDSNLLHPFDLSSLNSSNGFVLNGVNENSFSGSSISGAGDINGDGIDDLIIGAAQANPNDINNAGSSYVVFGSDNNFPNPFDLSTLNGLNGFVINGVILDGFSGDSVSAAGDINGDGIGDLIVGASGVNSDAGSSYVVFGSDVIFKSGFE